MRVRAAGINPVDVSTTAGYLQSMLQLPYTLDTDFAGEAVEVGEGIRHVKHGDAVYGFVPFGGGTFAENALVKGSQAALKPEALSFEQAAVVPLNVLAAWQGLFQHGQLQPGGRVLIHSAAGAVGSFAVQLAKHHRAYVIGTAARKDEDFARGLGLDEFIDYQATRFED